MPRNKESRGLRKQRIRRPIRVASETERQRIRETAPGARLPSASAVRPVVAMRRKPHIQRITLKTVPPAATAARKVPLPRCPVMAVSHSPRRGTVILLAMAGRASMSMRRSRLVDTFSIMKQS